MTSLSAASGRSDPRRRLVAMALLLVLSLGLGGALAFQAISTARRHRATAERALQDYADFAAFILASHSYRQIGSAVVSVFGSPGPWLGTGRHEVGPYDAPAPGPQGMVCGPGTTWFEEQPAGGSLRSTGAALDEGDRALLADTLKNAMPLLNEVGWRFRWIRLTRARSIQGVFVTSHMEGPERYSLRGFSACLGTPGSPFRQVMQSERALPPSVTGNRPADSLFAMAVAGARGAPLYESPMQYASTFNGRALLGSEFGDLAVHVGLRGDIASQLVIGGVPSSPTPLAIGLLAISTLLVVTALLQLRREYELIRARSDFVSSVSHELRTPLSQMLIFTELLKLGRLRSDAERQRALDIVDQEVRRLIRLVENVLQFSRSGLPQRRPALEAVPLPAVVSETIEAFHPLAAARGSTVTLAAEPAMVNGDPAAIRQILLNLLDNAMKYGPKGQTVRVVIAADDGRTQLAVEDQGPGVPVPDRERVWEGFYRLQRERQSSVAGSGIGLAVVRSLTQDMGGRAWIEDAPAGGARFVVELQTASDGAATGAAPTAERA
jgi:signal transduction histidine kinase